VDERGRGRPGIFWDGRARCGAKSARVDIAIPLAAAHTGRDKMPRAGKHLHD